MRRWHRRVPRGRPDCGTCRSKPWQPSRSALPLPHPHSCSPCPMPLTLCAHVMDVQEREVQYHQAVSRLSQEMADYKAQHVAVTNEQYNALQHNHAAAMQARRLNMLIAFGRAHAR